MPKYIFLDTNILSDYTKKHKFNALSQFVQRNDYTIVVNSLLLVELYNEGWEGGDDDERGARIVRFLGSQHCVIVDPMKLWHHEFSALPERLKRMPIELDLDCIPDLPKAHALLNFLRRGQIFLDMGKDIAEWANNYSAAKQGWLSDKQRIIENGCNQDHLQLEADGRCTVIERQQFLASLDLRLHPTEGGEVSDTEFHRYLSGLSHMRAVRLTSLAFLYKYIEYDPQAKPRDDGSDLGDIYFMSVLPWCAVYTADKNMLATVRQAALEAKCTSCRILGRKDLDSELRRYKA